MAVLTDHPYASLTLPDDAAADCLFLRPGQPGLPPFLLHRGGGDLPNSQEVREGRSSTTTPNRRNGAQAFLVGGKRGAFSRSPSGATLSWLKGIPACRSWGLTPFSLHAVLPAGTAEAL